MADHELTNAPPPARRGLVRKGYVDGPWGQVHYHVVKPARDAGRTAVVFFHPNPFSAIYFDYTLEALGTDRVAIAFDTPGYGQSASSV
jgi:pimeloyl-ACP methyl ester carboxylesterase